MTDFTVAEKILGQMGGQRRLIAMVGARNFAADERSVGFTFSGSRKANTCRVILDPAKDLYIFELYKINARKAIIKQVYSLEGVYFDMLIDLFESKTGLYLRL